MENLADISDPHVLTNE